LLRLSRLTLPISRDDARIFFNDAVTIAKEIDEEAIDQVDFLSVAAKSATFANPTKSRKTANEVYAFVSGVSERLAGHDRFPWRSGVSCITRLDVPLALAAIARWADDATVSLETTLGEFLRVALQANLVSAPVAESLVLLVSSIDSDVWKELAIHA